MLKIIIIYIIVFIIFYFTNKYLLNKKINEHYLTYYLPFYDTKVTALSNFYNNNENNLNYIKKNLIMTL